MPAGQIQIQRRIEIMETSVTQVIHLTLETVIPPRELILTLR